MQIDGANSIIYSATAPSIDGELRETFYNRGFHRRQIHLLCHTKCRNNKIILSAYKKTWPRRWLVTAICSNYLQSETPNSPFDVEDQNKEGTQSVGRVFGEICLFSWMLLPPSSWPPSSISKRARGTRGSAIDEIQRGKLPLSYLTHCNRFACFRYKQNNKILSFLSTVNYSDDFFYLIIISIL